MIFPSLSAILIIGDRRERAVLSLRSILEQSLIGEMEVILLDCGAPEAAPIEGSGHPAVRSIRLKPNLPLGWVRAEGIRQARAPVVAFLEEHAWAMKGWAEAIVAAHAGPWAAVGPEMNNGNAEASWSGLLAPFYYPLYSPPAISGETDEVGHHNTAYKRDVLLAYGNQLEALIFPEELLVWRLKRDGYRLYMEPAMKVCHFFETSLESTFLINYYSHQGIEAGYDALEKRPWWKRLIRLAVLPLSPFRRALRLWMTLRQYRPGNLPFFWRCLPLIFWANSAAALGGMAGLVVGMRDTPVRFLNISINMPRIYLVEGQPRIL